ncbi:hypothetical protein ACIRRI_32540 [Streptomyces mirabilis]|uniref:hypothetical protein n=1 Tax=Streptomyces mirabilis TaxID=68239 RepID=UPI0038188082
MTRTPRTRARQAVLNSEEAAELDRLARRLQRRLDAVEEARADLSDAAGRIAARHGRGGASAVSARVGWSRQHVSTLAAARTAEQAPEGSAAA